MYGEILIELEEVRLVQSWIILHTATVSNGQGYNIIIIIYYIFILFI